MGGKFTLKTSTSTPSTPTSGHTTIFIDSSTGRLKTIDDAGNIADYLLNGSDPKFQYIDDDGFFDDASKIYYPHGGNVGDFSHTPTLFHTISHAWSTGKAHGFELTDLGNGSVNIADGDIFIRNLSSTEPLGDLKEFHVAATNNLALTDNSANYIYVTYNSGSPVVGVTTNRSVVNGLDKVLLFHCVRIGNLVHYVELGRASSDFVRKHVDKAYNQYKIEYGGSGAMVSEVGTRKISVTASMFYIDVTEIPTVSFNTNISDTFTSIYRNGVSGWTRVTSQVTVDNLQYDNGTGTLVTLDNNKWAVKWVYLCVNNPTCLYVVYGRGQYNSQLEAEAETIPSTLPPEIDPSSLGVLIAQISFQKSATNFARISSPFLTVFSSTTATSHNSLSGLQGGAVNEYYHLTQTEYSGIAGLAGTVYSTGLTKTGNDLTVNLSTGVSGGQSVIGGNNASNNLTLSSTSNGTKGNINFGASYYNEGQNTLALTTDTTHETPTTNSEIFSSSGWTSSGWSGSYNTFTHNVGNTTSLSNSFAPTVGAIYKLVITVNSISAGTFSVTFGGNTSVTLSTTQILYWKATTTANLVIIPVSAFDGSLSFSLKTISVTVPSLITRDSTSTNAIEGRFYKNSSESFFIGKDAGGYQSNGVRNIGLGYGSLRDITSGSCNIAVGTNALSNNYLGSNNIAVGCHAGYSNTGSDGIFIGYLSGYNNTSGGLNYAIGTGALYTNSTQSANIAIGYQSLYSYNLGSGQHTAIGTNSGRTISGGSTSVFIGASAGNNGSQKSAPVNSICIGANTYCISDNQTIIGNTSTTSNEFYGSIQAKASGLAPTATTNVKFQAYAAVTGFLQNNLQNLSAATNASSDYIATNNTGNETTNYIDFGINSSAYNDAAFTITGANDAYLYSASSNLCIGTASSSSVKFFTSGTLAANESMRITSDSNIVVSKASGKGFKVDFTTPTFPYRDLLGYINIRNLPGSDPSYNVYRGNVRQYQFSVGDAVGIEFHLPHDYVPGTDIYIHSHWSHISAGVSSGSTTWTFETTAARGHNQEQFSAPITATVTQNAPTGAGGQYKHMIAEVQLSATSPSGTQIANSYLEPDSLILVWVSLTANSMTSTPEPFLHFVDIHYQSTEIGTKQKAPNFYT